MAVVRNRYGGSSAWCLPVVSTWKEVTESQMAHVCLWEADGGGGGEGV